MMYSLSSCSKPSFPKSGSVFFAVLDACVVSSSSHHEPIVSATVQSPETNEFLDAPYAFLSSGFQQPDLCLDVVPCLFAGRELRTTTEGPALIKNV